MNKRVKKILFISLIVVIIGLIGTIFINLWMIKSTRNQIFELDSLKDNDFDAILVLGCKAYSDRPSLMLSKRLETGVDVYNTIHAKLLLSGDHGRKDYDEVNIMRDYILDFDISKKDIFLDHAGFNTYDSIYRAKYVFNVKKVVIVTQRYHMYRALYIANKLDLEAIGVLASDIPQKGIMLKNEIREVLSRDKNYFKALFKPKSKYLGEIVSLDGDGTITDG